MLTDIAARPVDPDHALRLLLFVPRRFLAATPTIILCGGPHGPKHLFPETDTNRESRLVANLLRRYLSCTMVARIEAVHNGRKYGLRARTFVQGWPVTASARRFSAGTGPFRADIPSRRPGTAFCGGVPSEAMGWLIAPDALSGPLTGRTRVPARAQVLPARADTVRSRVRVGLRLSRAYRARIL